MHLVVIAWLYVALMMAVAEASGSGGTLLGAFFTFVLYGAGPVALVVYLMGTPARKRAIKAREAKDRAHQQALASGQPNAGSESPADPIPSVGKEP